MIFICTYTGFLTSFSRVFGHLVFVLSYFWGLLVSFEPLLDSSVHTQLTHFRHHIQLPSADAYTEPDDYILSFLLRRLANAFISSSYV
jgi:hypothetical protein